MGVWPSMGLVHLIVGAIRPPTLCLCTGPKTTPGPAPMCLTLKNPTARRARSGNCRQVQLELVVRREAYGKQPGFLRPWRARGKSRHVNAKRRGGHLSLQHDRCASTRAGRRTSGCPPRARNGTCGKTRQGRPPLNQKSNLWHFAKLNRDRDVLHSIKQLSQWLFHQTLHDEWWKHGVASHLAHRRACH